jgi:hypothetical protein
MTKFDASEKHEPVLQNVKDGAETDDGDRGGCSLKKTLCKYFPTIRRDLELLKEVLSGGLDVVGLTRVAENENGLLELRRRHDEERLVTIDVFLCILYVFDTSWGVYMRCRWRVLPRFHGDVCSKILSEFWRRQGFFFWSS